MPPSLTSACCGNPASGLDGKKIGSNVRLQGRTCAQTELLGLFAGCGWPRRCAQPVAAACATGGHYAELLRRRLRAAWRICTA